MVKCWVVIETTEFDELGIEILDDEDEKTIFAEQDEAERELLRIQKKHPDGSFTLFEAISYAKPGIKKGLFFVEKIEGE